MTTLGTVTETAQTERSLILVKPDGFRRGLTGEVIRRIEAKGYTLAGLSVLTPTREQLAAHYAEHEGKPFYEPLLEFMASGPVAAVVIEGQDCIKGFRSLAGATKQQFDRMVALGLGGLDKSGVAELTFKGRHA